MRRTLVAILLALGVIVFTVSLARASIGPPREPPPVDPEVLSDQAPLICRTCRASSCLPAATHSTPQRPTPPPTGRWKHPSPPGDYGFGLAAQPGSYYLYAFGGMVSATAGVDVDRALQHLLASMGSAGAAARAARLRDGGRDRQQILRRRRRRSDRIRHVRRAVLHVRL